MQKHGGKMSDNSFFCCKKTWKEDLNRGPSCPTHLPGVLSYSQICITCTVSRCVHWAVSKSCSSHSSSCAACSGYRQSFHLPSFHQELLPHFRTAGWTHLSSQHKAWRLCWSQSSCISIIIRSGEALGPRLQLLCPVALRKAFLFNCIHTKSHAVGVFGFIFVSSSLSDKWELAIWINRTVLSGFQGTSRILIERRWRGTQRGQAASICKPEMPRWDLWHCGGNAQWHEGMELRADLFWYSTGVRTGQWKMWVSGERWFSLFM